eukprot:11870021-Alexandrium_andersonii.AAC.1
MCLALTCREAAAGGPWSGCRDDEASSRPLPGHHGPSSSRPPSGAACAVGRLLRRLPFRPPGQQAPHVMPWPGCQRAWRARPSHSPVLVMSQTFLGACRGGKGEGIVDSSLRRWSE